MKVCKYTGSTTSLQNTDNPVINIHTYTEKISKHKCTEYQQRKRTKN